MTLSQPAETRPVLTENDIVKVRQRVRELALSLKFSLVEQTKIITAASEIARNTLIYGGGGEAILEIIQNNSQYGIKMTFVDQGPGIADIDQAMQDHFTSGRGLGLGLSGSKRLMSEFYIESMVNKGTRVTMIKWR